MASRDGAVLKYRNTPWRRIATATAPVCLFVTLCASFITAGCTVNTPAAQPEATLRIGARGAEAPSVLRSFLFAEGLTGVDWQGRPTQRLATDWIWEKDGRALRVRLRPDVRFHDDTPVTAPVVVEIIRQQLPKPETRGFEAVESVEAVDQRTILFHLSRPDGFLPNALAGMSIVDDRKPDIGTGPFKLVPNAGRVEGIRNSSYYRGKPGIANIQVIRYSTPRASWVGLMRNEVDFALDIKESVEFLEGAAQFEIFPSIQPFYIPLVFNLRHPLLARVEVRRAISDAIDRDEIVRQGMRGRGQVADDPVWPSHWAYNTAAPRHAPNQNAARLRLDAAGLPVRPAVPGRRASRFQLNCIFYNEDPQFERIGLVLQRQLAAVGIDLVLEGLTAKVLVPRIAAGQFDSYLFQLTSGRDLSWTYRFWHSPNGAFGPILQNTGYNGADAVLDLLRQTRNDDDASARLFRIAIGDLRQRFYDDVPAVFLAWPKITRAIDARFDIGNRTEPEIFGNLWRWQMASPQIASR